MHAHSFFCLREALFATCVLLVIGASRSEPHTSDVNRDFPFVYIIYLPYVRHSLPVFYFNDIQYLFRSRMRIRRKGHRSEHFDDVEKLKRASSVTSRD